jgi:hypothetical protein
MSAEGGPNPETQYEKVDNDDSVAGSCRRFGGDCAACWPAKSSRSSVDELGPTNASGGTGGAPPARADQVPSEKNLMNPNDPVNQENAALDRMINGICRGC